MQTRVHEAPVAVILGGHFLSLAVARELKAHQVPVCVMDQEICVTQFSNCVEAFFRCPPPGQEDRWLAYYEDQTARHGFQGGVIFPTTDDFVRLVAQHRDELSQWSRVTIPAWETTQYLYDKRLTQQLALRQRVPIPETCCPGNAAGLQDLPLAFPVVLKPAITAHLTQKTHKKAYRADGPEELSAKFQMMAAIMDPAEILVQELIPGRAKQLYSYFGYFKDGCPLAGFAARRTRQHPMEFGKASTYAYTTRLPELERLSIQLLSGLKFTGLAEVEFMFDVHHDRFELLEVNPRIWGWFALAHFAGVDLAYLAYQDTLGRPAAAGNFKEGSRWMRFTTDILTVASEMAGGRLSLRDYLRSIQGCRDAVFSPTDPLPFLIDLLLLPYFAVKRGF